MAPLAEHITLEEAIRKSESMSNKGYAWIIDKNLLNLKVPMDHVFDSIGVFWFNFISGYVAAAYFPSTISGTSSFARGLKKNNKMFADLEELRRAYPKLFEASGYFSITIQ